MPPPLGHAPHWSRPIHQSPPIGHAPRHWATPPLTHWPRPLTLLGHAHSRSHWLEGSQSGRGAAFRGRGQTEGAWPNEKGAWPNECGGRRGRGLWEGRGLQVRVVLGSRDANDGAWPRGGVAKWCPHRVQGVGPNAKGAWPIGGAWPAGRGCSEVVMQMKGRGLAGAWPRGGGP